MGSILSAISDDEDEYEALCHYYKEIPIDCYSDHAGLIKSWRRDNRPPPVTEEDIQRQKQEVVAYLEKCKQGREVAQREFFFKRMAEVNQQPLIEEELRRIHRNAYDERYLNQELLDRACSEILRLREQVRRLESRLRISEDKHFHDRW